MPGTTVRDAPCLGDLGRAGRASGWSDRAIGRQGQCMRGFGPERSKVCAEIGAPHSGHARSARSAALGGGVVSYGPTAAGPAARINVALR